MAGAFGVPTYMPSGSNRVPFGGDFVIRGMPLLQTHPGKTFWVYNGTVLDPGHKVGSDSGPGNFNRPFATINYALKQCRANKGDIIVVKPGHAETVTATSIAVPSNAAGAAIIGMGYGNSRPTLTFSTTTSTIAVACSNFSVQNILHVGGAATTFVAAAYSIANAQVATDFTIDNCEFRDTDATHGFVSCVTIGTTANIGDGFQFTNNKVFRSLTSPPAANTAVVVASNLDRMVFGNNIIVNTTANNNIALGLAMGANNLTHSFIVGNRTQSLNTGTTAGELMSSSSTASSGLFADNYSWHLASTGLLAPTGTKMGFVQNFCSITGAADKSALINPVAV
jgi:hypothetical protein